MNIQKAKDQIREAITIYLMKDEYGNYRIPLEKQRPVFLIGAPGIGKTAIMEQIAKELDIGIVAYSMTHHTRQSALGLPFIVHRKYQGESYNVSEYTMSEIIASVYEYMEKSGKSEGILFLDEINCVSETLGPSMLQFLQYKTFGNHRIPRGWVVVTAGNPPEYNRSVREFDIATLDRLKVINAEPDFQTWKNYAEKTGIHRAVLTYLELKPDDFYDIETTADGREYVTARGWEDLSEAMYLYEEQGFPIDESFISQYVHHPRIAGEFATYYELYHKYRNEYQIQEILEGTESGDADRRAGKASFDERITLIGLLVEAVMPGIRHNVITENCLRDLHHRLIRFRDSMKEKNAPTLSEMLTSDMEAERNELKISEETGDPGEEERIYRQYPASFEEECLKQFRLDRPAGSEEEFGIVKEKFAGRVEAMKSEAAGIDSDITNIFRFIEKVYGDGNEMLLLVTDFTVNDYSVKFLNSHGNREYFRFNNKYMLSERENNLQNRVKSTNEF